MAKENAGGTATDREHEESAEKSDSILRAPTSRREFVKAAAVGGTGLAVIGLIGDSSVAPKAPVYVPPAKMMILHNPVRCIGCERCEIVCSLYHDNKTSTVTSRVHLSRNYAFGPEGPRAGYERGAGLYGNYRYIADTCQQCAHPVPCMSTCPQGAIEMDPNTQARVVNPNKCIGCGKCAKACPWAMPVLDKETLKSSKCDLCGGNPQCVKNCPAGAMTYVPWRDRSKEIPPRQTVPGYLEPGPGVAESCDDCHAPGSAPVAP